MINTKQTGFFLYALLAYVTFFYSYSASAETSTATQNVSGRYAKTLPIFSLKDPFDKPYTSKLLAKRGVIFIVTAPIQANESDQKGWNEVLRQAKKSHAGRFVFIQDMTPSFFKNIALSQMKKSDQANVEPVLLIDHDGSVRKSFNVEEKSTVVLAYNAKRRLVYEAAGPPSALLAGKLWNALK